MNIKGVVWDSCPGPYPEVTLIRCVNLFLKYVKRLNLEIEFKHFRYTVFTVVFLLCCLRDWTNGDATLLDFFYSSYFIIVHRIIPSIKKKLEGIPITFGLIQGKKVQRKNFNSIHKSIFMSENCP